MQTFERNGVVTADQLYRWLVRAHSPLAAALMAAAVTGEWPRGHSYTEGLMLGRR
ncbi:hypothetical protein [Nocardia sp. NPDC020380]|uniref:hypothetical protein n=1 Tax=Nocardia sp. NPDC020380 TaxID=3364309 RepID=UPI00379A3D22